jgi:tRNA threonylcarbamoyladenosine biosynthesis protein TsaE
MANAHLENPIPTTEWFCESVAETREAGRQLAGLLRGGEVLSLEGPLGAGKTTFVQGLAEGLGCRADEVSSPTFTLVHEYPDGRLPLVHLDLYRLDSPDELAALGFDDLLAGPTIAALEWGDKFPEALPPGAWRFVFSLDGEARKIRRMP